MVSRKPVLLIDNTESSQMAIKILQENNVQFVEYHINKFELDCCVDLPTTQAPALFAPEEYFEIYKESENISRSIKIGQMKSVRALIGNINYYGISTEISLISDTSRIQLCILLLCTSSSYYFRIELSKPSYIIRL